MRLSDQVADWLADNTSGRVYAVTGGAAMFLTDSIYHHPRLKVTAMHHEQAAAFAAEGDFRITGKISTVLVTAGPGGTNAMTGVAGAFVDSIPLLVLSGQVESSTLHGPGQRQKGMNEIDVVAMATPVTKYARTMESPAWVHAALNHALEVALSGRPGPVWVDLPLDVQAARAETWAQAPRGPAIKLATAQDRFESINMLKASKRPVLVIGNGIRIADAVDDLKMMIERLRIPIVATWGGIDLLHTDHPRLIGRIGLFGDRAANFTVQNADLIISLGARLSVSQTGHHVDLFAPKAMKIVVDIDEAELRNKRVTVHLPVHCDVGSYMRVMEQDLVLRPGWLTHCQGLRAKYPTVQSQGDVYNAIRTIARDMESDAIVVADVGCGAYAAFQSMPIRAGQRLISSGGAGAMGWSLPAAIGACIGSGGRPTYCIAGDGGIMMNLQELATLEAMSLPITVFIFLNGGYSSIRSMQERHFGRAAISTEMSGLRLPDLERVSAAFGLRSTTKPRVHIFEISHEQELAPVVLSRLEGGKFRPTPIHLMHPFLPMEETDKAMGFVGGEVDYVASS